MGLLRFLFSLSVVFAHSPIGSFFKELPLVGGALAVQSFFMISGFYIGMILDGKYHNKFLFWSNRAFRILPSYWAVLALMLVYIAFMDPYSIFQYKQLGLMPTIYIALTSVFVLGQDASIFMSVKDHALYFVPNFLSVEPKLFAYFYIPQAWTLALEFYFYLMAPFICRAKSSVITLLLIVCLVVRFYFYNNGYDFDPWTYRFFPFEIALFMAGILAYRIYKKYLINGVSHKAKYICFIIPVLTILYPLIPDQTILHASLKLWVFLGLFFVLMPLIFAVSKDNKFDRFIGDLSFPMYVCHMFIIRILNNFESFKIHPLLGTLAVIILTVLMAYGLHRFIEIPVDRYRMLRVKKYNQANLN